MKTLGICRTNGSGLWSEKHADISILEIWISSLENTNLLNSDSGSLWVRFDRKNWKSVKDGLIYTDKQWIKDFRKLLIDAGFSKKAVADVCYSEQGRQGQDYVNLDVGQSFLIECDTFIQFASGKEIKPIVQLGKFRK